MMLLKITEEDRDLATTLLTEYLAESTPDNESEAEEIQEHLDEMEELISRLSDAEEVVEDSGYVAAIEKLEKECEQLRQQARPVSSSSLQEKLDVAKRALELCVRGDGMATKHAEIALNKICG